MPFTTFTGVVANHTAVVGDDPGTTGEQFKTLLDKGVVDTKSFINSHIAELELVIGAEVLTTADQTLTGAVNELVGATVAAVGIDDSTISSVLAWSSDKVNTQLSLIGEQLVDTAITPESYVGNALQKIQFAVNDAITQNQSIRFSKVYDITGLGSIVFNKPEINRNILHLIGAGGGIKKTDSGIIFTSSAVDMGDISSAFMQYISVEGAGTIVWDCNKLIRISSLNDTYKDVDNVLSALTRYLQSARVSNCLITGGLGWAFEWSYCFDTTINDNTIEERQSGIRSTTTDSDYTNMGLRICNNVIEGLTGNAILLGSAHGLTFHCNYFEACLSYVNLSNSTHAHHGLSIIGNTITQSAAQITANLPSIILGLIMPDGVFSSGNVSNGILYETTDSTNQGKLVSIGDVSMTGFKCSGVPSVLNDLGTKLISANMRGSGIVENYYNSYVESPSLNQDDSYIMTVPMPVEYQIGDVISVSLVGSVASDACELMQYRGDSTNVILRVKNLHTGSQKIVPNVSIMRIKA